MDYFLNLLIVTLTVVSTMNCDVLNRENILQSQIDNLLTELQSTRMDAILYWNLVTLQTCANDYDTSIAVYPDQFGPTATSRAFAIIHGAMYESIYGSCLSNIVCYVSSTTIKFRCGPKKVSQSFEN